MRKLTASEAERREQLLFGTNYEPYGYKGFSGVSCETIHKLVDEGFLELRERQNDSPSTEEFLAFTDAHPEYPWIYHGYAIGNERPDVRVTIEGIYCDTELKGDALYGFISLARNADDFCCDELSVYCWWD